MSIYIGLELFLHAMSKERSQTCFVVTMYTFELANLNASATPG